MVGSSRGGEASICMCMNVYNYLNSSDINFPLLRIFNGVTGRYELLFDNMSIDAYGRVRDSSGCVVEWFTGVFDMNGIPLFENDIIMPVKDGISQYRRIWRTIGGFVLSRRNDVKGLSRLDMIGVDYLVNERVQQYISDGCVKVGSAIGSDILEFQHHILSLPVS